MKIKRFSILRPICILDLPEHTHPDTKRCFWPGVSMNYIYFQIIDEEKPQGKTLYFSPYLYVTNRKWSSAFYSLPSAEKSLFFSLMLQFCRFFTQKKCSKKNNYNYNKQNYDKQERNWKITRSEVKLFISLLWTCTILFSRPVLL